MGIVLLLQPVVTRGSEVKAKGPPLCVANTHLLFNPRRGDVKLAQLAIMLAEIDSVVKSCKAKGEHCNLILCGDFNSVPKMPLYQLITTGELFFEGLPAWMVRLKHCKDQLSIINAWKISSLSHMTVETLCFRLAATILEMIASVTMYVFTISNRYQVKKTCHTKSIVTDCLPPCGPAVWESLTPASTRLSRRYLRARVRNQVSV